MIGDIIALIEFIKNQREKKTEIQRNLIEDFVNPVFSLFKKVHDDYLTTFRKYQDAIESSNTLQLSLIIEEIKKDSLFSKNLRYELLASLSAENQLLSEFISEIDKYLKFPGILIYKSIQPWSNLRRDSLIEILSWIDGLTPEIITGSGLYNEIQNFTQNQRSRFGQSRIDATSLVSSLELTIRNTNLEVSMMDINENDLRQAQEKINDIKRYLAIQCIDFIVKETQENYNFVVNSYWRLKLEVIRE